LNARRQGGCQGAADGGEIVVSHPATELNDFRGQRRLGVEDLGDIPYALRGDIGGGCRLR